MHYSHKKKPPVGTARFGEEHWSTSSRLIQLSNVAFMKLAAYDHQHSKEGSA
jgi:hypothetical protein